MLICTIKNFFSLFLAFIFCLQLFHYQVHTTDDAYIFFRYAENIVQGYGIVWNQGESPVEGFSSPLWLLILVLGGQIGFSPVIVSKVIGGGCVGAAVFLIYHSLQQKK